MNVKTILVVALACAAASLSGCASMGGGKDTSALTSGLNDDVDLAYIAQVNHEASRHFGSVTWVNPPQNPQMHQPHE